ncbi:MAG: sigma-70 family RNA polymerase sigma factor [Actinomycetia bacterium]|nr:sigma-70 family RNA polymerase sigma factor [Actinomycetes bacterium]
MQPAADVDPALYHRFRHGDLEAFRAIVQAYEEPSFRLVYLWAGDRILAEDVVQDAFWKAWTRRTHLRDPDRFAGWFLRILANVYRDRMRREPQGVIPVETVALVDPDGTPEERALAADEVQALRVALAQLRWEDRLAVTLRYYDGLSVQAVAGVLHRPPNTVASRIHRALGRLRTLLTQDEEGGRHAAASSRRPD